MFIASRCCSVCFVLFCVFDLVLAIFMVHLTFYIVYNIFSLTISIMYVYYLIKNFHLRLINVKISDIYRAKQGLSQFRFAVSFFRLLPTTRLINSTCSNAVFFNVGFSMHLENVCKVYQEH